MHKILSLIALREKENAPWGKETVSENKERERVEVAGVLISKSDIFPLE